MDEKISNDKIKKDNKNAIDNINNNKAHDILFDSLWDDIDSTNVENIKESEAKKDGKLPAKNTSINHKGFINKNSFMGERKFYESKIFDKKPKEIIKKNIDNVEKQIIDNINTNDKQEILAPIESEKIENTNINLSEVDLKNESVDNLYENISEEEVQQSKKASNNVDNIAELLSGKFENEVEEDNIIETSDNQESVDDKIRIGNTIIDKKTLEKSRNAFIGADKERNKVYRIINNIVFALAIPMVLIWAMIAFSVVSTEKTGYLAFGNYIYVNVSENNYVDEYDAGELIDIKRTDMKNIKAGDIVAVKKLNDYTGLNELRLLIVTENNGTTLSVKTDSYDSANTLFAYFNIGENNSTPGTVQADDYVGVVTGKDVLLGKFFTLCQNIVVYVFIVIVPAMIILIFLFINLSDSVEAVKKQKKMIRAEKVRKQFEELQNLKNKK